ncbi:hypothetical protein HYU21_04835 [Candidatus Woesearchaeota archaeon]|nr:hypothetical protein [Candidatus Woesearchaeota archaeon]
MKRIHLHLQALLQKSAKRNTIAYILVISILAYTLFISLTIQKVFSFKVIDFKLLILLIVGLIIPLVIFFLFVNVLLPEIRNLYHTKDGLGKGLLKRTWSIFVFYLLTGILMQFIVEKTVYWLTSLEQAEPGISAIYANMLTPLLIFFVRKSGNESIFRDVLYANLLFILFFLAVEIPVGGFKPLHLRFFVTISGIMIPTLFFTALDVLLPRDKIRGWFK